MTLLFQLLALVMLPVLAMIVMVGMKKQEAMA